MQDFSQNNGDPTKVPDDAKHPGSELREVLAGLGLTPRQIASEAGLSPIYLNQLIAGKASMVADVAVRLAAFTGTDAQRWMDLQVTHDLAIASEKFENDLSAFPADDDAQDVEPRSKYIIEMTCDEAREFLLEPASYCSIQLPEYFQFGPLLSSVATAVTNDGFSATEVRRYEGVNHRVMTNKDGRYAWRPLEVIHPALYVSLVNEITDSANWATILEKFRSFTTVPQIACLSLPVQSLTDDSDRAAQIQQWHTAVEQKSIELSLDYDYLFQTDIVDCYASIYSHSIAWALHGKDEAKQNRRDLGLVGNSIDHKIQDMHLGQTNGIPQGSTIMDFIAEMVLGYADTELAQRCADDQIHEYQVLRYRDDYRIFVNSPPDGEVILKRLTEVLAELGLQLNPAKTGFSSAVVRSSIKADKLAWIFRKQRSRNFQDTLLMIHDHGTEYPNSGRFGAALSGFHRRLHNVTRYSAPMPLIAIAVDIAVRNPGTYPYVAAILGELIKFVNGDWNKLTVIERAQRRFSKVPNCGHMDVWLQRISYPYDQLVDYAEPLCKLVTDEGPGIWNSDWLNSGDVRASIEESSLIDREKLREMDPTIDPAELQLFRFGY